MYHFCLSQFHCAHSGSTPGLVADVRLWWSQSVTSQTKYPSLTSSGVTAALLMFSPGLGPPPRLVAEWIILKSRLTGGLVGRTPEEEESAEVEALDAAGCPLDSMTVLMAGGGQLSSHHLC